MANAENHNGQLNIPGTLRLVGKVVAVIFGLLGGWQLFQWFNGEAQFYASWSNLGMSLIGTAFGFFSRQLLLFVVLSILGAIFAATGFFLVIGDLAR